MPPEARVSAHHFDALGTTCSLFGVGVSASPLQEGETWVRELGARLTRFSTASELVRLNSSAGRWMRVSAEMEEVLRESLRAFELSAGLVNAAVLESMMAIGYTRTLAEGPTATRLRDAHSAPRLPEVLEVRAGAARLSSCAGLDLGGIAKGWMADRLSERLGRNVLVNLGGDLRARGDGPEGSGWPVGIAGHTVLLQDHGAATSSVRRRRWGDGLHHLIDPRTGRPADTGLAEASVVAETAAAAEVIAKAAVLAGPELAPTLCATHAQAWWLLAA
jgi:thiamine biosynthesis lipoprotein